MWRTELCLLYYICVRCGAQTREARSRLGQSMRIASLSLSLSLARSVWPPRPSHISRLFANGDELRALCRPATTTRRQRRAYNFSKSQYFCVRSPFFIAVRVFVMARAAPLFMLRNEMGNLACNMIVVYVCVP